MTTTIKARVYKSHPHPDADISERHWRAFVTRNGVYWFTAGTAQSMPEALQLAYLGLKRADRWLMDPVHASRASRREATA